MQSPIDYLHVVTDKGLISRWISRQYSRLLVLTAGPDVANGSQEQGMANGMCTWTRWAEPIISGSIRMCLRRDRRSRSLRSQSRYRRGFCSSMEHFHWYRSTCYGRRPTYLQITGVPSDVNASFSRSLCLAHTADAAWRTVSRVSAAAHAHAHSDTGDHSLPHVSLLILMIYLSASLQHSTMRFLAQHCCCDYVNFS